MSRSGSETTNVESTSPLTSRGAAVVPLPAAIVTPGPEAGLDTAHPAVRVVSLVDSPKPAAEAVHVPATPAARQTHVIMGRPALRACRWGLWLATIFMVAAIIFLRPHDVPIPANVPQFCSNSSSRPTLPRCFPRCSASPWRAFFDEADVNVPRFNVVAGADSGSGDDGSELSIDQVSGDPGRPGDVDKMPPLATMVVVNDTGMVVVNDTASLFNHVKAVAAAALAFVAAIAHAHVRFAVM